ncbi:hypothetical protein [uncultured Clostridium sp.]|uniref:hypothetical protein n=1 Tax=uncultured Clostridium sp. TaxID=59620 RepID=UPI0025D01E2E|nr:hypothetical protein [uncultured Clostridium sp.]
MIELVNLKEMNKVTMFPNEVQNNIKGILTILDEAYGEDRSKNDDGGYVIVVEKKDDFKDIENSTNINIDNVIVEYVDIIECSNDKVYTSSLVLCSSDYSISLIIPMGITPKNILNQM